MPSNLGLVVKTQMVMSDNLANGLNLRPSVRQVVLWIQLNLCLMPRDS